MKNSVCYWNIAWDLGIHSYATLFISNSPINKNFNSSLQGLRSIYKKMLLFLISNFNGSVRVCPSRDALPNQSTQADHRRIQLSTWKSYGRDGFMLCTQASKHKFCYIPKAFSSATTLSYHLYFVENCKWHLQ